MFRIASTAVFCAYRQAQPRRSLAIRFLSSTKTHDPLRILFCGSDEYSIASLKALHAEHKQRPDRVASIDVVCRPGKRVGRGLKQIREVPIKAAATDLSLPIHEIDTFTKWTPPELPEGPINLIVAVSFGLFVPSRILNAAKYGGLNVHPSMLPDFYGPAPLHHTILAGRARTGVTLQTLHEKHFDRGLILQQTPPPGFEIPNPDSCTVPQLLELVAPKSGEILVDGIRKGLFVPPLEYGGPQHVDKTQVIHAVKLTTGDRHLEWNSWDCQMINRRNRVIGPQWNEATVWNSRSETLQRKRVILTEIEEVQPLEGCEKFAAHPGLPFSAKHIANKKEKESLYVWTADKKLIRLHRIKVEGDQDIDAFRAASRNKMFSEDPADVVCSRDYELRAFRSPLS